MDYAVGIVCSKLIECVSAHRLHDSSEGRSKITMNSLHPASVLPSKGHHCQGQIRAAKPSIRDRNSPETLVVFLERAAGRWRSQSRTRATIFGQSRRSKQPR